ncbi:MAG: nucleotidyltransferase family protein [Bacillota bacterium]|nr:nucleotidyltransferase family protein [Bacillota bacterium]MDW7683043.1 nucleotidyltransferase family protein [Bacillota bacterium]
MFDVLILAGTGKETELTEQERVKNKAFIQIHANPMLSYVIEALRDASDIGRIAVVGPVTELTPFIEQYGILALPEKGSIPENIKAGFDALQPRQHFLIVSADIPFLSAAAINNFLTLCRPYDMDFYYPVVPQSSNDKRFPGVVRTYVKLLDGTFTGGNLFLVNPGGLESALPRIEKFFALRKSPVKLAAALGIGFVIKLITRRLTIAELETRFSGLFSLRGKAVVSEYAEIGTDVDKPADLILARKVLADREL